MASDDFTDSNGTALSTHDSLWTTLDTYSVSNLEIQSNECRSVGVWSSGGAYYDDGQSSNQESQAVFKAQNSTSDNYRYVGVRGSSSSSGYEVRFGAPTGGNWTVITLTKDDAWINSASGSWSQTSDHTIKISVSGDSPAAITVDIDSTEELTHNDSSSPITNGNPSIRIYPSGSATEDCAIDDWTDNVGGITNYTLPAGSGSISMSGQSTGLLKDSKIVVGAGSISLSGQNVDILYSRAIKAGAGSIGLSGQYVSLLFKRTLAADSGAVSLNGQDVTLTYSQGVILTAEPGSISLSGQNAGLILDRKINIEPGSIVISGQNVIALFDRLLSLDAGSINLSGQSAYLLRDLNLIANAETIALSGKSVTLTYSGYALPNGCLCINFTVKIPALMISSKKPNILLN